jgi:pimeloyl-ACP methyl ester carboxylesterase
MPDREFGLEDLVNDLERVRERTGFVQAHFAGQSLGGMIGPAYARKHLDRVMSLGVLSTAAGRTEGVAPRSGAWFAPRRNSLPMLVRSWARVDLSSSSILRATLQLRRSREASCIPALASYARRSRQSGKHLTAIAQPQCPRRISPASGSR